MFPFLAVENTDTAEAVTHLTSERVLAMLPEQLRAEEDTINFQNTA
jgi:hypothetical protein